MTVTVIDLSHHNTVPTSLVPAQQSGVYGLIHKATESTGFVDSKLKARYALAREAGMLWGVYHFLRPGNIQAQVEHFLETIQQAGVFDQYTLLAADHEDPDVSPSILLEFLETVEEYAKRSPVLYSGHVLKEQLAGLKSHPFSKYRLWLAQYGPKAELPPGFTSYWLWQYTDKGTVPGITPPTDLNRYEGPLDQLQREWAGRANWPDLEPTPVEEQVVNILIDIDAPPGIKVNVTVINEEE